MSGDLVAELTLRLQNEMSGGIEAIREGFTSLDGTLAGLRDVLAELTAALGSMTGPVALESGMESVLAETESVIKSVGGIGDALDADIKKADDLAAALAKASAGGDAAAAAGAAGGGGGGEPTPIVPPGDPDAPDGSGEKKHGRGLLESNAIGELIAIGSGYEGAEYDAKLQVLLTNITNTEKIHGAAAAAEQLRIGDMMHKLALQYNTDSGELLATYNYLITTGIQPGEVDALMPGLAEAGTAHGIAPTDMGQAVMALAESFKITPEEIGVVLAQMGYATKMGHFSADSFSAFLPQIGGALASVGVSGSDSADYTFAAMESIIKGVSIPSEAATDYTDFIHYIGTQHAERTFLQKSRMMLPQMREIFSKYGIGDMDLWGMENNAVAEGKDPVQTVLDFVHNATSKMTPVDRNAVVSDYFTNQQGGDAVRALMQYWNGTNNPDGSYTPGFQDNFGTLKGIGQDTLDADFHSAVTGAAADMNTFKENLNELNETMGNMFDYFVSEPANAIMGGPRPGVSGAPNVVPGLGPMHPNVHQPIEVNIKVGPDGSVSSVQTGKPPPGVNVRVNQGPVLGHI